MKIIKFIVCLSVCFSVYMSGCLPVCLFVLVLVCLLSDSIYLLSVHLSPAYISV
jgi:hypothetical protein